MSEQYTAMWQDLNLDLPAHDLLLNVLGEAYQNTFLTQANRPEGMDYFDFVMSEVHGLRIKELVDLKASGRKVIGAYCVFVPEELVLAAGAACIGLCAGADFATEEVEKILPRNSCALIKSFVGFKLGRVCPYIEVADMIVGENTCDGKKKAYEVFGEYLDDKLYVMDMPQMKTINGRELLKGEYWRFKEALEALTGNSITLEKLQQATEQVNAKRRALHRLAALRAADPAPISGLDALLINQVAFYDDPERFTASVNKICDELEARVAAASGAAAKGLPRVLVSGCPMAVPNWKVPAIVEGVGAVIVGEESCIGERGARNLTDNTAQSLEAQMEAIVERYFAIDCAIFTPNRSRIDHVLEMVKTYKADAVIHYGLQFCQPYASEAISVERELEAAGIPCLRIETDYSQEDVGQLRTRIEAFVELLD